MQGCVMDVISDHLQGSRVSLHSSHAAGAAVKLGLRSEAHAHSKRLSHVLDHRRPCICHNTPHKGHGEVKGQHQGLQILQVTNLRKSHQIHMHTHLSRMTASLIPIILHGDSNNKYYNDKFIIYIYNINYINILILESGLLLLNKITWNKKINWNKITFRLVTKATFLIFVFL